MLSRTEQGEKRDFIRMAVDCDVFYRKEEASAEKQGAGRNLSANGILFESEENYAEGSKLFLRVMPRNSITPPLEMQVEVVRSDDMGGNYLVACRALTV